MLWPRKRRKFTDEIAPDEILLDSSNQGGFNRDQFEGRMERALSRRSLMVAGAVVALLSVGLLARAGNLQLWQGVAYAKQAQDNQLAEDTLFADRGEILDRTGRPLAYNERQSATDDPSRKGGAEADFAARVYAAYRGVAHVVGYAKSPAKDQNGFYYRDSYSGVAGAEEAFNTELAGVNGDRLTETDARGKVVSESTVRPPQSGKELTLSVDAAVSQGLYDILAGYASSARATGAAGVVMDVRTGEILAMVSYPEYEPAKIEQGDKAALAAYNADTNLPFLDRATDGLYAPGSIVKPVMAAAGLTEGVITPNTQIISTGQISVPNPYDPEHPSIFKDWRVNGLMTVRDAIAVSSDVFFYEVGGGFQNQKGIGINKIGQYLRAFGLGSDAGLAGYSSKTGTIPSPAWKATTFPEDPTWRLGDTYHTAIGQYGVQVTPLQAVRMIAAVASGNLLTPTLIASSTPQGSPVAGVDQADLEIVREGMRQGVTKGIATAINFGFVHPAAKTGTAQVGLHNEKQNAWMVGFWPYENPHYAYAVVLEHLPAGSTTGGSIIMSDFFNWLHTNQPQYLQ
ncbi:MAG: penicillin-binding transpeptidase domain-containing protein [Patescibacteria group bacterium]